jgi:hypothetical protein
MLKRPLTIALLAGAAWMSQAAQAGELALFSGHNFSGREMRFNGAVHDLSRIGFNDQSSSLVVRSGRWQVCEHANFEGQCVFLDRGEYPDLRRLGDRISSLREVDDRDGWGRRNGWERGDDRRHGWEQRRDEERYGYDDGRRDHGYRDSRYRGPAIEMYRKAEFRSDRRDLNDAVLRDFSVIGFNDRAQSLVIRYGQWEFCEHADFRGTCEVYGPGRYPHLGHLSSRMSSVRRVR